MTITLISHYEATGSVSSITFSSIPTDGTYTDLMLVFSIRNTADINTLNLKLNGSTSNQTARRLLGTGASASSSTYTEVQNNPSSSTTSTFASGSIYIPNFTSSAAKSISMDIVSENNATTAYQTIEAWLWNPSPNVAITSIALEGRAGGSIAQYSSATLYGVKSGSDGITSVS